MMRGRLKIKSGQVRAFAGAIATGVLLLAFQNCAQPMCAQNDATCAENSGSTSKGSSSSSGSKNNSSSNGGFAGGISMGSGGGSSSNSSGNTVGGISVGGGGGSSSGSGVSVGGGGGGNSGGSSGSGATAFGFLTQPSNMMVREGEKLELKATITGGKVPFTYQWYRNSKAVDFFGNYSNLTLDETTWKDAGSYFLEVSDAAGVKIRTTAVDVTIVEKPIGCDAGSYFTYTAANFDMAYNYIPEYFDSSRGKYLLHRQFDNYNFFYTTSSSFTGMKTYNVPALAYKAQTYMSCQTSIPRIHTPTQNPGYDYGGDRYNDGNGYRYTGNILFECRNNKLLFVSNTCKWSR